MASEWAGYTLFGLAVFAFKLKQCLCTGCAFNPHAVLAPLPYYTILFGVDMVKQLVRHCAESLFLAVPAVNMQHGDYRVDDYYIYLFLSHASVAHCLCPSKACVVLPITAEWVTQQPVYVGQGVCCRYT